MCVAKREFEKEFNIECCVSFRLISACKPNTNTRTNSFARRSNMLIAAILRPTPLRESTPNALFGIWRKRYVI